MNSQDSSNNDIFREFLGSASIEKAPDGFTAKTMARLYIEASAEKKQDTSRFGYLVPVVSSFVTILLVLTAIFLPAGSGRVPLLSFPGILDKLRSLLPRLSNDPVGSISVPEWLPYMFLGIIMLVVFDKALASLFNRKGKSEMSE